MRYLLFLIIFCSTLFACSNHETVCVYIDAVEVSKEQLEKLDSSEIFSYTKYRSGEAPPPYSKGDDTTVIVVKTKTVETRLQKERHTLLNRFLDSIDNGSDVLIVEDGILVRQDEQRSLRSLIPTQLRNVDIMEWSAARRLYGSHARPITLVINLYSDNSR